MDRRRATSNGRTTAASGQPATDRGSPSLWFDPPTDDHDRRLRLTRERVVTEALAVIAEDGVQALTMRHLAARLGVVPAAVYRHVRSKQQLQDLLLDGVLAEIDFNLDPALPWTERLKVLSHRLRQALEQHPGVAAILKTGDPLGPHSLALAEAILGPLQAAGFHGREAGLAFFLLVDYTIGFAVSGMSTSVNEQRVRDPATRSQLHQFFRSLPPTASPPWSLSGNTSGSTTATSGSPPAWMRSSSSWNMLTTPVMDRRTPRGRSRNDPQGPTVTVIETPRLLLRPWQPDGFGPRVAIEKATGRWVGRIGLSEILGWPGPDKIEVGWELHREFWGRGLATEGGKACMG